MKVLDLQCTHAHGFEGWFASAEAFETQLAAGLIGCPICADTAITKRLSAPRLNLSGASARTAPAPAADPAPGADALQARWLHAVREVMSKTEDVGQRFAEEARRMHYGETQERSIRGQASTEEAESLRAEGVPVVSFRLPAALKESSH
jgi:hypothetical protein